ncbi:glycosyltransferase family 61 protein [Simkania sp.]|uniref:glycosyltransferase family 61 protein n=1 Tax=Simkania sp. TaxID=34094 RepID=UPI003B5252E0
MSFVRGKFSGFVLILFLLCSNVFSHEVSHGKVEEHYLEGTTFLVEQPSMSVYGHGLLDGVFPLYVYLFNNQMLDSSFNVIYVNLGMSQSNSSEANLVVLTKDIFHAKEIKVINKDEIKKRTFSTIETGNCKLICSHIIQIPGQHFFRAYPKAFGYMKQMKRAGLDGNFLFYDSSHSENIVTKFTSHILDYYQVNEINYPKNEKLILISKRAEGGCRVIKNIDALKSTLEEKGWTVRFVDCAGMSIADQIKEVYQCQYFMGATGSNLVNAMFLPKNSTVVFIYPKHSRIMFRNWDTISAALLSNGVQLLEYEKPKYDTRDDYPLRNAVIGSKLFDLSDNILRLKPCFANFESITGMDLYPLYNMNFYITPEEVVQALEDYKFCDVSLD